MLLEGKPKGSQQRATKFSFEAKPLKIKISCNLNFSAIWYIHVLPLSYFNLLDQKSQS